MTANPSIARRSVYPKLYARVLRLQTWLYQRGIHYHCDLFGQCCPGVGCCRDMRSKGLFGRYAPLRIPSSEIAAFKRGVRWRAVLDGDNAEWNIADWFYFTPVILFLPISLPPEPKYYRRSWRIFRIWVMVCYGYITYSLIYIF